MNNFEKIQNLDSDGMVYFLEKVLAGAIEFDKECMEWFHCSSCSSCVRVGECIEQWLWSEVDNNAFD